MTPSTWRKAASTPQKHPAPKVAFFMDVSSSLPVDVRPSAPLVVRAGSPRGNPAGPATIARRPPDPDPERGIKTCSGLHRWRCRPDSRGWTDAERTDHVTTGAHRGGDPGRPRHRAGRPADPSRAA